MAEMRRDAGGPVTATPTPLSAPGSPGCSAIPNLFGIRLQLLCTTITAPLQTITAPLQMLRPAAPTQ